MKERKKEREKEREKREANPPFLSPINNESYFDIRMGK
jgi:hypothetical protein